MKLSNTSRSISEISAQASVLVPLTLPSKALPLYMAFSPQSEWHVSALLASAVESITLPSRLKLSHSSRETLTLLANSLNVNGNQTIAKIQMSIGEKTAINGSHAENGVTGKNDSRMSNDNNLKDDSYVNGDDEANPLDMDFFPTETGEQIRGPRRAKKVHVFGRNEIFRTTGDPKLPSSTGADGGYERARRRAAGLTIIQRLVGLFFLPGKLPKLPFSLGRTNFSSNTVCASANLATGGPCS